MSCLKRSTKAHHPSPFNNWTQHAEKCLGKRMFKVKAAQKGRPKNDVKHSAWIQSFFNFLSSQIKSEVKLDDVNKTEMGKANKSVKMRTQILYKLSGSMFFKWKKRGRINVQHVK